MTIIKAQRKRRQLYDHLMSAELTSELPFADATKKKAIHNEICDVSCAIFFMAIQVMIFVERNWID